MKGRKLSVLWIGLWLLAALHASALRVQATLGESVASVDSDSKALSGVRLAATVHDGYSIQEITAASVVLKEFVSPSGVVFGITWHGLIHPDLTQILGSYASKYKEGLLQIHRGQDRRRLRVTTDQLVVEQWGHMRNLQGRAYAPDLIPQGLSIDEIR